MRAHNLAICLQEITAVIHFLRFGAHLLQYIASGVQEPRFIEVLKALTTPVQLERVNRALAPILAKNNR